MLLPIQMAFITKQNLYGTSKKNKSEKYDKWQACNRKVGGGES